MSVESNWSRIVAWCEQHAPSTLSGLRPPQDRQAVLAAESATGRSWPKQLHRWFALHDGVDGCVIPGFGPLSTDRIVEDHAHMTTLWQDMTDELGGHALTELPAGEETGTYLSAYIPIADDGAGDFLVVDTRDGERSGCLVHFFGEGVETVRWNSIDAMLDDVASALEHGTSSRGWVPIVDEDRLYWDFP